MAPARSSGTAGAWRLAASGLLLGVAAPLVWSTGALLVKILPFAPLPLAGMRALIAGLALAPFWRPRGFKLTPALAALVGCYTVAVACYVAAVKLTTAANAIALQATAPAWVLGLTWLAERRIQSVRAAPAALVLLGVAVVLAEPAAGMAGVRGVQGNLLALAAGAAFGAFTFLLPRVPQPAAGRVALCNLGAAAALFLLSPGAFLDLRPAPIQWLALLYLGAIQIGLATVCFAVAVSRLSVMQASVLALLEPLLSPLWVYLAIGERPSDYGLAGGACIFAGIAADLGIRMRWPRLTR
jgi:drug/metabolite transporter (DMT)-like permease